jgi:NADPH:quinone reductase-like Zn-dependent oxidoreductase
MRAAWIEEFGGPEVIRVGDLQDPVRSTGEVLVRVQAATLNHRDVYLRRGEAGKVRLPVVLGSDGAGVVAAADENCSFRCGQSVAIYPVVACGSCASCRASLPHKCRRFGMIGGERQGTHAQYSLVPEACLVPIPDGLDAATAAAISLAGLTAWNMVEDEGHARTGEHALVLGASGGVGVFTVRLLKRLGVHVHVVTSSLGKEDDLLALGADTVLVDSPGQVLAFTRSLPEGGVDLAFNWVGGNSWRYVPAAVRPGGRILVCGSVRSPVAELDIRQIFYRNVTLIGCSMGTPNALRHMLKVAAADDSLRIPVDRTIGLDGIADGHRHLEAGAAMGKVLVYPW